MANTRAAEQFSGFPKEAFDFFEQLARHNDRDWFHANQDVYERACREPMKQLVAELPPRWSAFAAPSTAISRDGSCRRSSRPSGESAMTSTRTRA